MLSFIHGHSGRGSAGAFIVFIILLACLIALIIGAAMQPPRKD